MSEINMNIKHLSLEVAVVGGLMALALAGVSHWSPASLRSVPMAALVGFILGALFHLGFEFTGLNRTYCSTGHACVN